ncbi:YrbL family protein [Acinetobacter shaoyimingii]|uniref:PhoP regulatory network protein YrbL n=1 Tax=Acinetobacter shaoyimingii TaxID=2715164 RepID=A0A6G8RZT2_9GAMM|nr:YrbL family protein [Acinetobacter shaoyimingii]NHB59105.1 hypothetical protein [Acinetobacter shaoyimingii]QIO07308.1 hypothetical protein G8E00_15860 [Acinetobacter shaoyimingii]
MYLKIENLKLIGQGCSKIVYQHPDDQNKIIKIMNPQRVSIHGGFKNHSKMKQRFAQGIYRHFRRELIQYLQLCKVNYQKNQFTFPVETPYGFIHTDQGLGLIAEKIVGPEEKSLTLEQLARTGQIQDKHLKALDEFFDACCDLHIVFAEVNIAGIMYTEHRNHKPEFVLVDGMGEKLFIPLRAMFKSINTRNVRKVEKDIKQKMRQMMEAPLASEQVFVQ